MYQKDVFGKSPARPPKLNYEARNLEKGALGGKEADRRVVTVYFSETRGGRRWTC